MPMSMLEKVVMNIWNGVPRFGRVIEERTENNWSFVKVDWVDDGAYQMDRQRVLSLRNETKDDSYDWYRADKVKVINPSKLIKTLSEL